MITCNSEATYALLKDVNKEIMYINNGVEINRYLQSKKIKIIKNIGVVANISRRKNVKLVIEALKYLPDNFNINIAGKVVDNQYYEEVINYIKENNLESKVNILDYVKNMDEFYEMNDLIVLPSFYEGTSNVVLESFSRKKLILLSNIKENIGLIDCKYKELITFNPNSAIELSDKINNLNKLISLEDKIIDKLIQDNYNFVINEYSIEKLQEQYMKIVKSC